MKAFWSRIARELSPYVPGEQPRIANLVKLNTSESPFGPSPLALEAMRAAAVDTLRLYPDPEAQELREALAVHHGIKPEQVFVGNGSDEVLAHAFVALLKQSKPLLFPDVTYSFYPVWAQLFGLACETVPLDGGMRIRVEDYRREAGSIVIANPNAPTGVALTLSAMRANSGKSPAVRFFTIHSFDDRPDIRTATMKVLLDHLAAGRIRPLIHNRLPLADAGRAQALLESGQVIGKLLLKP